MDKVYDYIVLGSGLGGSVASLRLSEKGKRFHADDIPKSNWNLRKYLWLPKFGFFGFQKLTFNLKASILEFMFDRPPTAHIPGGCPMSENIADGVVNPGLYIVDGSVIEGNVGVNPSFTILAMAEYAMSNIPEKK